MADNDGMVSSAVADFLKEKVTKANGLVYRPELPKGEPQEKMPRACIVVYRGGGGHMMGGNRYPMNDFLLDLACYGEDRYEAEQVADEAETKLRYLAMERRQGCTLYWARIASSNKSAVDSVTMWPFALLTIQVLASVPE